MGNLPKISIIVAVYNVENYLNECMDSIVNQKYGNIEIICVNDGSTDKSADILREYAIKDNRITIIDKSQNEGLLMARKSGVEAATGEYIIFVDSDDYISVDLCSFIEETTQKEDADIIHFSSDVADPDGRNLGEVVAALKPLETTLTGNQVLESAYIEKAYATQIWGKVYKSALCKTVYNLLPTEHCYVGEDVFTYFFLSYFAKKYKGIKTPYYYKYRYGFGVSGLSKINLARFEMFCKMSNWVKYTLNYLTEQKAELFAFNACECMKIRLFNDCCEVYRNRVKPQDRLQALMMIYKYWDGLDIPEKLWLDNTGKTYKYIMEQYGVPEEIKIACSQTTEKPKISVITVVNNNTDALNRCYNYLSSQSLDNIDIIIVNDGSVDNAYIAANRLYENDKRVSFINQKSYGKSKAYNTALEIAKGEYLLFCDIDAVFQPDFLEKIYNTASSKNADVLYFDADISINHCLSKEEVLYNLINKDIYTGNISYQLINTKFLKSHCLKFDDTLRYGGLLLSALIVAEADKIVVYGQAPEQNVIQAENNYTKAEEFLEYFKIYNLISAKSILSSQYNDTCKNILGEIAKKYYTIANSIYLTLSKEQQDEINNELSTDYKPLLFSMRENKNIKDSFAYKTGKCISDILIKISAILKRK